MQMSSKRKVAAMFLTGIVLCVFGTSLALAAGQAASLGSVAKTIQGNFSDVSKLMTSAAYIIGVGFVIASLFKFKAHKDNPTQEQIGKPIALLFIGASMIFIPSVMKTGGATIFGSSASSAGVSGISTIS
ncbi:MAG: type IV secretion protein IcmD [Legionellales bacterium]|nr:type IV secretion protein IcmD [Legionellales bacterium]